MMTDYATQYNTITVTTFNALNNPSLHVQRVMLAVEEAKRNNTDILLLQEILPAYQDELASLVEQEGLYFTFLEDTVATLSCQAVVSTVKPLNAQLIKSVPERSRPVLLVEFDNCYIINVHLAWGEAHEWDRLESAYQITKVAQNLKDDNPDKLIILGGDFNATLDSMTLRYLQGLDVHKSSSTHWTNAWDITSKRFSTARKDGGWAETTAAKHGIIIPDLIPFRIIDHLFSFGWNYGKKGSPLTLDVFGVSTLPDGRAISDHYGITVQFLLSEAE